jgi:hypothetical protein
LLDENETMLSAKPILDVLFKLKCDPDLKGELKKLQAFIETPQGGGKKRGT